MTKSTHHCHKLIKETAIALAFSQYEELMQNNDWWRWWKETHPGLSDKGLAKAFVGKLWPRLVGDARATLAKMLAGPTSEVLKEEIYNALLLDNSLPAGQVASL